MVVSQITQNMNWQQRFFSYIDSSPALIADGFNIIETGFDAEQMKEVFKMIFEAMQQEQHYKMMMNTES